VRKIVTIAALALIASCKKGDTGGDAVVVGFPKHHTTPIKGATIYVKFDATEMPSDPTNNYDLKIVGESNEDHVHIEGLRYGNYYLHTEGYDSTVMAPVHGGYPLKIKWSQRKKEIDVDLAVSE